MKKIVSSLLILSLSLSLVYADVATKNVIIREEDTSPSGVLRILNVTNGTLTDNGSGNWSLDTGGGGGSLSLSSTNPMGILYISSSNTIASSPLNVIDANNNVGIATTAPLGLLQVGTSPGALLVTNTNVGIGVTSPIGLLQVGTNPLKPGLLILPNNNVGIGWTSPVGLLQVSTTPSSGLVVLYNGNVGIGTTNPAVRLQVVGDYVRIGDGGTINFADGDGDLYVEDELEVDGAFYNKGIVYFGGDTASRQISSVGDMIMYDGEFDYYGTNQFAMLTSNKSLGSTYNDTLYLALWKVAGNSLNFIIGEYASRNIDYLTSASLNPTLRIQSANTAPNNFIQFFHDQTNANIQTGSGTLNITSGSTAPTDLLYIRSAGTGTNVALRISNTAPADVLGILDNGNVGIATTAPMGILQIGTSPGALLMVLNTGKVGIGTTAPSTPLTIIAPNTAPANNLYLNGTAGARLIISSPDASCSSCGVDNSDVWSCISVTCP